MGRTAYGLCHHVSAKSALRTCPAAVVTLALASNRTLISRWKVPACAVAGAFLLSGVIACDEVPTLADSVKQPTRMVSCWSEDRGCTAVGDGRVHPVAPTQLRHLESGDNLSFCGVMRSKTTPIALPPLGSYQVRLDGGFICRQANPSTSIGETFGTNGSGYRRPPNGSTDNGRPWASMMRTHEKGRRCLPHSR